MVEFAYMQWVLYSLHPNDFLPDSPTHAFDFFYHTYLTMTLQGTPDWSGVLPQLLTVLASAFGLFFLLVVLVVAISIWTRRLTE